MTSGTSTRSGGVSPSAAGQRLARLLAGTTASIRPRNSTLWLPRSRARATRWCCCAGRSGSTPSRSAATSSSSSCRSANGKARTWSEIKRIEPVSRRSSAGGTAGALYATRRRKLCDARKSGWRPASIGLAENAVVVAHGGVARVSSAHRVAGLATKRGASCGDPARSGSGVPIRGGALGLTQDLAMQDEVLPSPPVHLARVYGRAIRKTEARVTPRNRNIINVAGITAASPGKTRSRPGCGPSCVEPLRGGVAR